MSETNPSSTIRWGVIGCGQIAVDKSLPGLLAAKGARLVAVADPLEGRRALALGRAAKNDFRPTACSDYRELLVDPTVDAVCISLPTGMHHEAVIAAAGARKAILGEKSLGNIAADGREMVRVARDLRD